MLVSVAVWNRQKMKIKKTAAKMLWGQLKLKKTIEKHLSCVGNDYSIVSAKLSISHRNIAVCCRKQCASNGNTRSISKCQRCCWCWCPHLCQLSQLARRVCEAFALEPANRVLHTFHCRCYSYCLIDQLTRR